jgi:hypothetical protein
VALAIRAFRGFGWRILAVALALLTLGGAISAETSLGRDLLQAAERGDVAVATRLIAAGLRSTP